MPWKRGGPSIPEIIFKTVSLKSYSIMIKYPQNLGIFVSIFPIKIFQKHAISIKTKAVNKQLPALKIKAVTKQLPLISQLPVVTKEIKGHKNH